MKLLTLIALIVLLSCITSIGQQIAPLDSSHIAITKGEFKHIVLQVQLLSGLQKRDKLLRQEISTLKSISTNKDSIISKKDAIIANCEKQKSILISQLANNDSFWQKNKFYIGAVIGIASTITAILLFQ